RVLPGGRTSVVEQALLCEQHEGPLRVSSFPWRSLCVDDLRGAAAEVDGAGLRDLRRPPGDRPVEGVVELEHARPVTPAPQTLAITLRQRIPGELEQLLRRHVAEDGVARGQLGERLDAAAGRELAPERAQPFGEGGGDRLRAAARKRQSSQVRES